MFDIGDDIALRLATAAGAAVERNRDGRRRAGIIDRVETRAAIDGISTVAAINGVVAIAAKQRIVAIAAIEPVIARAAFERVVAAAAGQHVVVVRTDQVLDIEDLVARRIAAQPQPAVEIGGDAAARCGIADRVGARSAVKHITPGAAQQEIVTRATQQGFTACATTQRVVVVGAHQHFDIADMVAERIAGGARCAAQVDRHRAGRMGICHRIDAGAAIDEIGTRAAFKCVITAAAKQRVIARTTRNKVVTAPAVELVVARRAGQRIIERRADHRFDVGQHVALRIAAGVEPAIQVHIDRRQRAGIADRVEPVATIEHIGARPANQRVIACATRQRVVAAAAGQHVIVGRADDRLDIDQHITLGIAARPDRTIEPDRDGARRMRIVGGILARAAIERVSPRAAGQRVIARAAVEIAAVGPGHEGIVARAAVQRVVAGGADNRVIEAGALHHFDRDVAVACGISGGAAGCQIERDPRCGAGIIDRVDPCTAIERVCPAAADQRVVARAAMQRFGRSRADQHIVVSRADHRLDIRQHIAFGLPARAGRAIKVHGHRRVGMRIIDRIEPGATVEHVRARAADQRIVAVAPGDRVAAAAADQHVVARTAIERVVDRTAGQRIVVGRADQLFDRDQDIARRIANRARTGRQRDRDRRTGIGIIGGVKAGATIQRIRPAPATQHVVAVATAERIVAGSAEQDVVVIRSDQVFDIEQPVTFGRTAGADRTIDRNVHARGRAGIIDRIEARTAIEQIGAAAAIERVVARTAQ